MGIILGPLSSVEFEIFYAIARLNERGETNLSFSDILRELNRKRSADQMKPLSRPAMAYHIKRFAKRKFVNRSGKNPHFPSYSLVEGLYKLRGWPPLCIEIAPDHIFVFICDETRRCNLEHLDESCLEKVKKPLVGK